MGLRGKNAQPLSAKVDTTQVRRASWQRSGLTAAERVISFVQDLTLTAGKHAGKKFKLRGWQKTIIRSIYGETVDSRVVRTALATMARKNGKTQLAAALAACHLWGPMAEARGEVYSAAADRNQSGRIFRELEAFIMADAELQARCNVQRFAKKIEVLSGPGAGSIYEALSSDKRKAHSLSPSFVVCDELAQWTDRELYDNLVTGTGARENPLVVVISTQSSDPNHVMSELVDYGEQVNSGAIEDPSFAAFIFTTPKEADVWDEANWHAANPALGDFRSLDEIRKFAEQAKRIPAKESVFRALYLNQRVTAEARFIPRAQWNGCALDIGSFDPKSLQGRKCYGGLDLSGSGHLDLTALVLVFLMDDGTKKILPFLWMPEGALEENGKRDKVPYSLWARQGHLRTTPGNVLRYDFIAREIAQLSTEYQIDVIAVDPWNIDRMVAELDVCGAFITFQKHGQYASDMEAGVNAIEGDVISGRLKHNGNPLLALHLDNVMVSMDSTGNRKFDKRKATGRIDAAVALCMAENMSETIQPEATYTVTLI